MCILRTGKGGRGDKNFMNLVEVVAFRHKKFCPKLRTLIFFFLYIYDFMLTFPIKAEHAALLRRHIVNINYREKTHIHLPSDL